MEIEINGIKWVFHIEAVNGEEVLAATWNDGKDSDTIWTKEETTLPLLIDEAGDWLDNLHWEVGRAAELDSNKK